MSNEKSEKKFDETFREKTGYENTLAKLNEQILMSINNNFKGYVIMRLTLTLYNSLINDIKKPISDEVNCLLKELSQKIDSIEKRSSGMLLARMTKEVDINDEKLIYARKIHEVIINRLHQKNLLLNVKFTQRGESESKIQATDFEIE